jgi:hypothetical protein
VRGVAGSPAAGMFCEVGRVVAFFKAGPDISNPYHEQRLHDRSGTIIDGKTVMKVRSNGAQRQRACVENNALQNVDAGSFFPRLASCGRTTHSSL